MILGFHTIISAYGFWLPNDPRGSWSDFVGAWELSQFGKATKTSSRQSVAAKPHNHQLRQHTKKALKYPAVEFSGLQARAIGRGFAKVVERSGYSIHACAILPCHVHLVIGKCHQPIRQIVGQLKGEATKRLKQENLHPFAMLPAVEEATLPSPWSRKSWSIFLDHGAHVINAIRYVEQNPPKEGKPAQHWAFVTPWDEDA